MKPLREPGHSCPTGSGGEGGDKLKGSSSEEQEHVVASVQEMRYVSNTLPGARLFSWEGCVRAAQTSEKQPELESSNLKWTLEATVAALCWCRPLLIPAQPLTLAAVLVNPDDSC